MLQLKNIFKKYQMGDTEVKALNGVSITFRENDLVSILGPSGCGKTTLLNIIGGLDQYSEGDLVINNISTKKYKDSDWDIYRNNSIGFVFQSYNLIPHQTVLSNVELALTLAGISKDERRKRATDALKKVGLADQLDKKPNQMSGGQMQRVAIARALVNNPDILLADEPTGALDSETSVQIMDILQEVAKDRLVIMVTHNGELAEEYSTRIIRLKDGKVIDDSNPYEAVEQNVVKSKQKKISMSFTTALSLSFKNLLTKRTRTMLTAFAGSIGIIGIALILSISSGMNAYISNIEKDALSTYPLEIESQTVDMGGMMSTMMNNNKEVDHDLDKIYSNNIFGSMITSMVTASNKNDLKNFKEYIESDEGKRFSEITKTIKYGYNIDLQIYKENNDSGTIQVNPSDLGMVGNENSGSEEANSSSSKSETNVWEEMLSDDEMLKEQYDVIAGKWPSSYDEVVLVVDKNNELSDVALYSLGILDQKGLEEIQNKVIKGEKIENKISTFSYDELLNTKFKLLLNTDYYVKENGIWLDKRNDPGFLNTMVKNAPELKISAIIRPNADANAASIKGNIGYTPELTKYVIDEIEKTDIVKEQKADKETDVFTGISFEINNLSKEEVQKYIAALPVDQQSQVNEMFNTMPEEEAIAFIEEQMKVSSNAKATYEGNSDLLGIVDYSNPDSVSLYPKDFESKEELTTLIEEYNTKQTEAGKDEYVINYVDMVGIMTSSISSIIDGLSYVLIAFVAISLVVSSIMIAIITYISVLERTKEIGILRSIGASKKDVTRVFNAETIIEGLVSGVLGIVITMLLNIPINMIIKSAVGISGIASLPLYGAVSLVLISIFLTVIAGFIPAKMAAKKDPVQALRSE